MLGEKAGDPKQGLPFYGDARAAAMKLLANLPPAMRHHFSHLSDHLRISLGPKHLPPGTQDHYQRILEAIKKGHKIRFNYDDLDQKGQISTLVSPYLVFYQHRTWFVIGRSSLHREVRTFHIGRILKSVISSDLYESPPRFSLKKHFGNAWRMEREKPEAEVIVMFKPQVARNVAEVIWHSTQRFVWKADGALEFHATIKGIHEISWWILGFGDQAEVIAPDSLRELIVKNIERAAATYRA